MEVAAGVLVNVAVGGIAFVAVGSGVFVPVFIGVLVIALVGVNGNGVGVHVLVTVAGSGVFVLVLKGAAVFVDVAVGGKGAFVLELTGVGEPTLAPTISKAPISGGAPRRLAEKSSTTSDNAMALLIAGDESVNLYQSSSKGCPVLASFGSPIISPGPEAEDEGVFDHRLFEK